MIVLSIMVELTHGPFTMPWRVPTCIAWFYR